MKEQIEQIVRKADSTDEKIAVLGNIKMKAFFEMICCNITKEQADEILKIADEMIKEIKEEEQ